VEINNIRLVPRYSFIDDIELTDLGSGILIKGQTKDLSLFGCSVVSSSLFSTGTDVMINISHEGANVKAFAKVISSSQDCGMGIEFIDIESDDERILDGWIADLLTPPMLIQ
jgi:hypothetical protein